MYDMAVVLSHVGARCYSERFKFASCYLQTDGKSTKKYYTKFYSIKLLHFERIIRVILFKLYCCNFNTSYNSKYPFLYFVIAVQSNKT